jgi:hypothetical protein
MMPDVLLSMVGRLMGEIYYFYEMNTFHRLMLLSWVVFTTAGCDSRDRKTNHRRGRLDSAATENTEFLRPDVFSSSPDKVEGCIGLYTYDSLNIAFDSLDVDKGKKILATKTTEFAFLRLHHKDIYLPYDRAKSGPIDKKTFKEVYRGNDYTVVLITRTVREEGESSWSTGTLEIIFRDKRLLIKVRGLSGC